VVCHHRSQTSQLSRPTRGAEPLTDDEYAEYLAELGPVWEVVDDHHLEATYEFDDFADALAFTNEIGELAEAEGITPISTSRGARSASRCGATTSAGSTSPIS